MGFNRRKMEDQLRQVAEKEAAARRATDAQVLEDAERLIAAWNERQALRAPMIFSPTIGAAIAAGYWFLGALPGLPNDQCNRSADTRSSPRRCGDKPHPRAILSILPAERAVRRSCAPVADEHRRRNARGAWAASAWRVEASATFFRSTRAAGNGGLALP
jgi:hypothetical protein